VPLLSFKRLSGVSHGISTRHGGVSDAPYATMNMGLSTGDDEDRVVSNRLRFAEAVGAGPETVISARIRHGNEVSVFSSSRADAVPIQVEPLRRGSNRREKVFVSDAAVSDLAGYKFVLTFADCVPMLFWDSKHGAIGAAHAGWRGTALGVAPAVVRAMNEAFDTEPSDLVVGIGPSIGPCCYAVGEEVVRTFRHGHLPFHLAEEGDTRLDLWSTNEMQLVAAGVPREGIENPRICTGCNVQDFYSHRAEKGMTGRFAACIGL
jgi:polyphenol oxidase